MPRGGEERARAFYRDILGLHPGLLVGGLREILEQCRQAGLEATLENVPLEGYRRAFLLDPFGNRLELLEPEGSFGR